MHLIKKRDEGSGTEMARKGGPARRALGKDDRPGVEVNLVPVRSIASVRLQPTKCSKLQKVLVL